MYVCMYAYMAANNPYGLDKYNMYSIQYNMTEDNMRIQNVYVCMYVCMYVVQCSVMWAEQGVTLN